MRHLALGMVLLLAAGAAGAQVVGNGLGTSVNTPTGAVTISGGTGVGNNLFHSFSTFNVATGDSATFTGASTIANIIARVTGGASSIDGTLRTATGGTTSLWFINPAGMTFGQNAQLDVTGSFHASTAQALKFGASGQFDMTNPPGGTLTVSPTAFVFLAPSGAIAVNGSQLSVPAGKQISLVASDVTLTGATLHAPSAAGTPGQVNLAAVRTGEVAAGNPLPNGAVTYGDLTLTGSTVKTWEGAGVSPGLTSGPIYIRGGKLTMNQSTVSTEHTGGTAGGNIEIALAGDLSMNGGLVLATGQGTGAAGNVTVSAANISMGNVSVIDTSGLDINLYVAGQSGQTSIVASGDVALAGGSQITSTTMTGTGGDISVVARDLSVSGATSMINAATVGSGSGGNIVVNARNVTLAGGGRISAGNEPVPAIGPDVGNGGSITINAVDSVGLAGIGSGVFSANPAFGNAGSITITAGHAITLADGARISTFAQMGQGGQITLTATDLVSLSSGRITTSVADGTGNGGDITIDPTFVTLSASQIIAQTFNGQGGHINIITPNFVCPDCASGGSLISAAALGGNGIPGTVQVSSPNVDAGSGLAVLPSGYFDPSALLRESCAVRGARLASSFVGAGRGALPAGPDTARFGTYALGPVSAAVLAAAHAPRAGQSALQGCSG